MRIFIFGILLLSALFSGCRSSSASAASSKPATGYTKEEATQLLGRRVRCVAGGSRGAASKCGPQRYEFSLDLLPVKQIVPCEPILKGSYGVIRELDEISPGEYFVKVHFDGPGRGPWTTQFGPEIYRDFLSKYLVIE